MSIAYAMKTGGGVEIDASHLAHERRYLDGDLRQLMRREQRREIIASLEERTGLPFALAIANIESWTEKEVEWQPWANFHRPYAEQPIMLVTRCYVRRVEYPALLDSNPANT